MTQLMNEYEKTGFDKALENFWENVSEDAADTLVELGDTAFEEGWLAATRYFGLRVEG